MTNKDIFYIIRLKDFKIKYDNQQKLSKELY